MTLNVLREKHKSISAKKHNRSLEFSWLSDTEHQTMLTIFREIVALVCASKLEEQPISDGQSYSREGPLPDEAYFNETGDALFFSGRWYGGMPGDAYRQIFTLFCSDGSTMEADVVDSCTQPTLGFLLWSEDPERLDILASAIQIAVERYYQNIAELFYQKSESLVLCLPLIASFASVLPDAGLSEKLSKHLYSWVYCSAPLRVARPNGDVAWIGQFLMSGLYESHRGVVTVVGDKAAIRFVLREGLISVHTGTTRLAEYLPRVVNEFLGSLNDT